ncbi:MAG: type II toxin-antitoxin system VapC family toxin [Bryobacteraceae bacterium]
MNAYADTSFLISLYTPDTNSEKASALFLKREEELVWITPFGEVEFVNVIELRVFRKEVTPMQAEKSLRDFQKDLNSKSFLVNRPLPVDSFERAILLSRRHTRQMGTRGMDVIHVAIALELRAEFFYTFDRGQTKLAKRAGLTTRPGR